MEGFTVKCRKCGNEAVFTQEYDKEGGFWFVQSSSETLIPQTSGGYGFYGHMCSACGNEVEGEY